MSPTCFYKGAVWHHRHGVKSHRLRYEISYVLVDLDRWEEAGQQSRFLSFGTKGLMSVRTRDHGDGSGEDLATQVRKMLAEHYPDAVAARIELLTLPRIFGYVFNPLSVYFLYDPSGVLSHVLYEVNNTFGERHFYLCPAAAEDVVAGRFRHQCGKAFYVSPFFDVCGEYIFTVRPPAEKMSVNIQYYDEDETPAMTAHLRGDRMPVTDRACRQILARFPLMTLGVIVGIHWEAVKLLLKGVRYRSHRKSGEDRRVTGPQNSNLPLKEAA